MKTRMVRQGTAAFLTSAILAGSALAQTSPAPDPAPATVPAMGGQFLTDQATGEFRASKFVGLGIYGPDNQRIGDVNEILIDAAGQARAIVIGVGGFLGIGEKNVAIPFAAVQWMNSRPAETAAATKGGAARTVGGVVTGAGPTTMTAPGRPPLEQAAYNGYPDHGQVGMTKVDLQNAPGFRYYADTHSTSEATPPVVSRP